MKKENKGMGIISVLTLVFIVLKLVGVISWSWWLVLSLTLGYIGLILILFAIIGIAHVVAKELNK